MDLPPRQQLLDIYASTSTIAVVGMSSHPDKAAHTVPAYLQSQGYAIIPVTPKAGSILGVETAERLADIGVPVDVVDVFRPAEEGPDIARAAAAIGAKVLWLQPGTESDETIAIAEAAGMQVIGGHCMRATHKLLGLEATS